MVHIGGLVENWVLTLMFEIYRMKFVLEEWDRLPSLTAVIMTLHSGICSWSKVSFVPYLNMCFESWTILKVEFSFYSHKISPLNFAMHGMTSIITCLHPNYVTLHFFKDQLSISGELPLYCLLEQLSVLSALVKEWVISPLMISSRASTITLGEGYHFHLP